MTGGHAPDRQLLVVGQREAVWMRLRLFPVRGPAERAASVNRGLGIVPLEFSGPGDHRTLAEVFHTFRRLPLADTDGDREARLTSAFAAWSAALAPSGIDLRVERRVLYGAPLVHTNWRADPRGISVRPWDVELTALAAALRTIVKLDRVPPHLVETLRDTAAERGLQVETVAPQGRAAEGAEAAGAVTLLVARDGSALTQARHLEAVLLAPGEGPDVGAATLQMGALLGYPRCCVERFTRVAEQNDTTLAWALLPGTPHPPAPPSTQWLQPGLALLSHTPCDLHCSASASLGERILAAAEIIDPGLAARWKSLAGRVQVVDHGGTRMALAIDGQLETGATITAADVLASSGDDPHNDARARQLVGRSVAAESGGLVVAERHWYAPYVADHRG